MLPNVICPGVQKGATTTLFSILSQHPDIYVSEYKETQYFASESLYKKNIIWYENVFFKTSNNEKIAIDISTGYMPSIAAARRIRKDLGPRVKFVFILRNPVERAYSHYLMMRHMKKREKSAITDAIKYEQTHSQIHTKKGFRNFWDHCYIGNSLYAEQVKRFLEYFSLDQMLFILFEDFINDTKGETNKIFDFLEVSPHVLIDYNIHSNKTLNSTNDFFRIMTNRNAIFIKRLKKTIPKSWRKKIRRKALEKDKKEAEYTAELSISQEDEKKIYELVKDDIIELEKLIKMDLTKWKGYEVGYK